MYVKQKGKGTSHGGNKLIDKRQVSSFYVSGSKSVLIFPKHMLSCYSYFKTLSLFSYILLLRFTFILCLSPFASLCY